MFCSHCGKSIHAEDVNCPHCGAALGEERFEGNMYTSAQARVPVDQIEREPAGEMSAFTRTDYMSYDNQPEDDLYSNTTYRPLLSDEEDETPAYDEDAEEAPAEDYEAEQPAADYEEEESAEAQSASGDYAENEAACDDSGRAEQPAAGYEDEQIADAAEEAAGEAPEKTPQSAPEAPRPAAEKYKMRALEPARISPKVQRYMRDFEERKAMQAGKTSLRDRLGLGKKNASYDEDYEEPAADIPGYGSEAQGVGLEESAADEAAQAEIGTEQAAYDEQAADGAAFSADEAAYDEAAYEDGAYDESLYEDEDAPAERSGFNFAAVLDQLRTNRKLQIGLGAVLAAVVLIFGIRYLLYVTSSLGTKIAGVTHSVYSQGINLITEYSSDTYRDDMVKSCAVNPTYAQEEMDKDMAALNALKPEAPQENDELFITTLTILHEAVQTVIKADAEAQYNGTSDARAEASKQEWAVVQDGVAQLKNATTVAQLTSLAAQVEGAVMPTATPSPEPVVTATPAPSSGYTTLQESSGKSDAAKKLQARLIELGYLDDKADGYFGAKTTEAVKKFQTAIGMTADGIATAAVQEALFASDAPAASAPAEPAASATDAPAEGGEN